MARARGGARAPGCGHAHPAGALEGRKQDASCLPRVPSSTFFSSPTGLMNGIECTGPNLRWGGRSTLWEGATPTHAGPGAHARMCAQRMRPGLSTAAQGGGGKGGVCCGQKPTPFHNPLALNATHVTPSRAPVWEGEGERASVGCGIPHGPDDARACTALRAGRTAERGCPCLGGGTRPWPWMADEMGEKERVSILLPGPKRQSIHTRPPHCSTPPAKTNTLTGPCRTWAPSSSPRGAARYVCGVCAVDGYPHQASSLAIRAFEYVALVPPPHPSSNPPSPPPSPRAHNAGVLYTGELLGRARPRLSGLQGPDGPPQEVQRRAASSKNRGGTSGPGSSSSSTQEEVRNYMMMRQAQYE